MQFTSMAEAKAFVRENIKISNRVTEAPYSFASGECAVGNSIYTTNGFSKCRPGDTFDAERGAIIAEGRVIAKIAHKLFVPEKVGVTELVTELVIEELLSDN